MTLVFAPAFSTDSATVSNIGTFSRPSTFEPPLPGTTPATTFVPYSTIWRAWNAPAEPLMPCTTRRVTYEFVRAERGVAFAVDDEIVDSRAPNDPACHVKVHVEYRYDPNGDVLEQRRDKVK